MELFWAVSGEAKSRVSAETIRRLEVACSNVDAPEWALYVVSGWRAPANLGKNHSTGNALDLRLKKSRNDRDETRMRATLTCAVMWAAGLRGDLAVHGDSGTTDEFHAHWRWDKPDTTNMAGRKKQTGTGEDATFTFPLQLATTKWSVTGYQSVDYSTIKSNGLRVRQIDSAAVSSSSPSTGASETAKVEAEAGKTKAAQAGVPTTRTPRRTRGNPAAPVSNASDQATSQAEKLRDSGSAVAIGEAVNDYVKRVRGMWSSGIDAASQGGDMLESLARGLTELNGEMLKNPVGDVHTAGVLMGHMVAYARALRKACTYRYESIDALTKAVATYYAPPLFDCRYVWACSSVVANLVGAPAILMDMHEFRVACDLGMARRPPGGHVVRLKNEEEAAVFVELAKKSGLRVGVLTSSSEQMLPGESTTAKLIDQATRKLVRPPIVVIEMRWEQSGDGAYPVETIVGDVAW